MAWNLADAGALEAQLDVSADLDQNLRHVRFGDNGNLVFYSDQGLGDEFLLRRPLSTPYDLATAGASDQTLNFGDFSLTGFEFKPDGMKLYLVEDGVEVRQHALTTAWDLTTFNATPEATVAIGSSHGLFLKPDGTKAYMGRHLADAIDQFPLTTAWDIGTMGAAEASLDISVEESDVWDVALKEDDGARVYYLGTGSNTVYQRPLATAWFLDSAGAIEESLDISLDSGAANGLEFGDSGKTLLYSGSDNATIFQRALVVEAQVLAGVVASAPWTANIGALAANATLSGTIAAVPWAATMGALSAQSVAPEGGRDVTGEVSGALGERETAPRHLVEIQFDSGPLRLWTGIGTLSALGETWNGTGRLGQIRPIRETVEAVASGVELILQVMPTEDNPDAPDAILNLALAEDYQGRPVTIWKAMVNPATNALIPGPFNRFKGRLDVMEDSEIPDGAVIKVTAENRLIDLERVRRRTYTPEDQKARFPGDTFFDEVAALQNREIKL